MKPTSRPGEVGVGTGRDCGEELVECNALCCSPNRCLQRKKKSEPLHLQSAAEEAEFWPQSKSEGRGGRMQFSMKQSGRRTGGGGGGRGALVVQDKWSRAVVAEQQENEGRKNEGGRCCINRRQAE